MRQVTTGLGLVEEIPPEAILRETAPSLLVQIPTELRRVLVEGAHWSYGALGGAAFNLLPSSFRRRVWAGSAYGLLVWVVFEAGLAPTLGLEKAKRTRLAERIMFALDHITYGVIVADLGATDSLA
jgi:uncharacterized membrane protein YagU involved in acid resistance